MSRELMSVQFFFVYDFFNLVTFFILKSLCVLYMGGFGISVLGIIVKMALWSVPMIRSECKIPFVLVS